MVVWPFDFDFIQQAIGIIADYKMDGNDNGVKLHQLKVAHLIRWAFWPADTAGKGIFSSNRVPRFHEFRFTVIEGTYFLTNPNI